MDLTMGNKMSNDEYTLDTVMTFAPAFIPELCSHYAFSLIEAPYAVGPLFSH
jgi:hypothetical protein